MLFNIFLSLLLVLGAIIAVLPPSYLHIPRQYDKVLHILYCLILFIFLDRLLPDSFFQREVLISMLVFSIGFVAEIIQGLLPYRSFSKGDIFANSVGILLGYIVISFSNIVQV